MANGNKVEVKRQIKWLLKFLLCLILLFNLTRCYYNAPIGYIIKPDDISQITVRSGTTGKTYEISKASQVDEFVEAISEYQMIIYTTQMCIRDSSGTLHRNRIPLRRNALHNRQSPGLPHPHSAP